MPGIILGTVQFGLDYGINNHIGKPSEKDVFSILDYAFDKGIRELDTADAYGNATEIIGKFHAQTGKRFYINSKFIAGEESVASQLSKSLEKLNIEFIQTYYFHRFDDLIEQPGILEELSDLKSSKIIHTIGLSVYDNHELIQAIEEPGIDVIQLPFNLLDNFSQKGDLLKLAREKGKTIHARSIFLQGLFFMDRLPTKLQLLDPYIQKLNGISVKYNMSIEEMAFRYAFEQQEIDAVLLGVDSLDQLRSNLDILNKGFDHTFIQEINQLKVSESGLLYPKNWK